MEEVDEPTALRMTSGSNMDKVREHANRDSGHPYLFRQKDGWGRKQCAGGISGRRVERGGTIHQLTCRPNAQNASVLSCRNLVFAVP